MNTGRTVDARIVEWIDRGLLADIGVFGLIPASHVGSGRLKNLDQFLGKSLPVRVVDMDRSSSKVILSHSLATEEEREKQKQSLLNALTEGQVRTGVVRRITNDGFFIDLGGIDGLLRGDERTALLRDCIRVGQEISVVIDSIQADKARIHVTLPPA